MTEFVGWISTFILAATISRQVYTQWKTQSVQGVSHWLFIGQLAASIGFVVYSALVKNWVFVCSNVYILLTAVAGQWIYMQNRRRAQGAGNK